ncbi:cyclin-domain-containing protein [Cunninghamella echinulata]|nr:cyclin-domain-containing protein [Cunninghamella echinulata]
MPTIHQQQPFDLVHHPIKETIFMLTSLLEKITKTNDRLQSHKETTTGQLTCFHARAIPSIDIEAYLLRILKYCPCTNECFLSLLIYFDRMAQNTTQLRLDSFNIHRLIISGIMVASKFFSDVFYTNIRYAKVGGIPVKELNVLELEFLRMNDFKLYIKVEELQKYGDQLLMHHRREQQRLQQHQQHHQYIITKNVDISYTHHNNKSSSHHYSICQSYHRLPTPPLESDHHHSSPNNTTSNYLVHC